MVLLSFDTEEFDVPCDYGAIFDPLSDGMTVSSYGINRILSILKQEKITATFFCTTNFAERAPELLSKIIDDGHEIASHGCSHSQTNEEDIKMSKHKLEELTGIRIFGYRKPRMGYVATKELSDNNYLYNASINPTYIPGRYNNLSLSKNPFIEDSIVNIPASVTPSLRIPLFWLSFHNLPFKLYTNLCKKVLKKSELLSLYFHPWEFFPLREHPEMKIPYYIKVNTGEKMCSRFQRLIKELKNNNEEFFTYKEYSELLKNNVKTGHSFALL